MTGQHKALPKLLQLCSLTMSRAYYPGSSPVAPMRKARSRLVRLPAVFSRSRSMRPHLTLPLLFTLCSAFSQRPGIADILPMRDCLDTACISQHAKPLGFCPMGGIDEDGYLWLSCEDARTRNWKNAPRVTIGFWFHGDGGSHYSICTHDTAYAQELTDELVRLGFLPPEQPVPISPFRYVPYRNLHHPDFFIRRDEVRSINDGISQLIWRFKLIKKH